MTRAEIRFYSSLDPRDPDYLDLEEDEEMEDDEPEDEWEEVDDRSNDYAMTEPELRGCL